MQAIPLAARPEAPASPTVTHEAYIHAVAALATAYLEDVEARAKLASIKLVFGTGSPGVRGTCYFGAWHNGKAGDLVEVCAFGRESDTQLAGTTLHELAHVLAGHTAGHGREWKAAASLLGLTTALAEAQSYAPDHFAADLWAGIQALAKPTDGIPNPTRAGADPYGGLLGVLGFRGGKGGGCRAGQGTRGGRSTGPGSGRNRLWLCKCSPPVRVRVASDDFKAQCLVCNTPFERGAGSSSGMQGGADPPGAPPSADPPTAGPVEACPHCGCLPHGGPCLAGQLNTALSRLPVAPRRAPHGGRDCASRAGRGPDWERGQPMRVRPGDKVKVFLWEVWRTQRRLGLVIMDPAAVALRAFHRDGCECSRPLGEAHVSTHCPPHLLDSRRALPAIVAKQVRRRKEARRAN